MVQSGKLFLYLYGTYDSIFNFILFIFRFWKERKSTDTDLVFKKSTETIDCSKYQLPRSFGLALNKRLKEKSALTEDDYIDLSRSLADSIEELSYAPNRESLTFLVTKLFKTHRHFMMDQKDEIASTVKYMHYFAVTFLYRYIFT